MGRVPLLVCGSRMSFGGAGQWREMCAGSGGSAFSCVLVLGSGLSCVLVLRSVGSCVLLLGNAGSCVWVLSSDLRRVGSVGLQVSEGFCVCWCLQVGSWVVRCWTLCETC